MGMGAVFTSRWWNMSRAEFELARDATESGRCLLGARDDVDVWFEPAAAKISFECGRDDDGPLRSSFFFLLEKRPLIRELMRRLYVCMGESEEE